jgi:hypothetical protein
MEEYFGYYQEGEILGLEEGQLINDEEIMRAPLKLLDYSVQSPTNTMQAQLHHNSSSGGPQSLMISQEYMEQQFEIMDPSSTGFDRLLNEEDKLKLRTIQNSINEYLADITEEEADMRNGYVSKASTILVPANPMLAKQISPSLLQILNGGSAGLANKMMDAVAEGIMS